MRKFGPRFFGIKLLLFNLLLGTLIIAFGEAVIRVDLTREESQRRSALMTSGYLIAQDIQRNVTEAVTAVEVLATFLKANNLDTSGFNQWSEIILAQGKTVTSLQLAPEGVITHCHPLEGNESTLGHDLLRDQSRRSGALKAIESRRLTFVGPVELIQNGRWGVIARKPVFGSEGQDGGFWGFAIAVMLLDDILPARLRQMEQNQEIYFSLRGDNPDAQGNGPFYISPGFNEAESLVLDVQVPNGTWQIGFSLPPLDRAYHYLFRGLYVFIMLALGGYIFAQQTHIQRKGAEISRLNNQLMELSLKDDLTGCGNRRALMEALRRQIAESRRYGEVFSVAMMDMDHFKLINDRYGHPAGDKLLIHFASLLKKSIRKSDSLFRIGGDEFFMIFPRASRDQAVAILEKLREKLEEFPCPWEGEMLPLPVSVGVAEFEEPESLERLMQRADKKLYQSKTAGRNITSS